MVNSFAFMDESGVLDAPKSEQPFFGVGMLKIADTAHIGERLSVEHYDYFSSKKQQRRELLIEMRRGNWEVTLQELHLLFASTRHNEYKFTNITFASLAKYEALLDTAFRFPLYFCALVVDKTDPLFDSKLYRNYWAAYIKYAKLLCSHNCARDERLCIVADYMNRPSTSETYFEHELSALPQVFGALRAHSETFILLQLCDLLLGSVLFQWRDARGRVGQSKRAEAKRYFVRHLTEKLGFVSNPKASNPLAKAMTVRSPSYFSVWPLKLSETK
jgi:hypothetical protein